MRAIDDFVKGMKVISGVLAGGVAVFIAGVTYAKLSALNFSFDRPNMVFVAAGLLAAGGAFFLSAVMFKPKVDRAVLSGSTEEKLKIFRQAFIQKLAVIEGAAFFNAMVTLTNGSAFTLILSIGLLLYLVMQIPTKAGLMTSLHITEE